MTRRGFSLVEVLIAMAVGLMLIAFGWQWLTGSSRVLSRGQNKMVDTNQAELVFRWIDQDVHTSAKPPLIEGNGRTLTIERHNDPDGPSAMSTIKVVWTFQPGVDGVGSYIERAPAGVAPTRFAVGALTASAVRDASRPTRPGLSVRLTMKQIEDASVAVFAETFVYQNQIIDPRWNPVGPIPEI